MRYKFLLIFSLSILFFSCNRQPDPEMREAWVPVYSKDFGTIKKITAEPARSTVNAGKIYTVGNMIYQVEIDSGIHVINYSNPISPQKIGFIRSFLCKEVSVKNGLIYTNNGSDLVVIEAFNLSSVREVARTPGVFPDLALQYPQRADRWTRIWFVCPDPGKGIVTSWEKRMVDNAKCWR